MTPILILLFATVILVSAYHRMVAQNKTSFLASIEYWVYLPESKLPEQDKVMTWMISENPFRSQGMSPIGPKEGLVFSDIRLHISLVRRELNPNLFRPDLFADAEASKDDLALLADSKAVAKIRYVSEEPLPDKRYIQFAIHAAAAYADLGNGALIYDVVQEKLMAKDELWRELSEDIDATRAINHLRTHWMPAQEGGFLETRGLRKIGRKDLRTPQVEADERLLITSVMEEAAACLWNEPALESQIEVSAYDDTFRIQLEQSSLDPNPVRIMRVQAL